MCESIHRDPNAPLPNIEPPYPINLPVMGVFNVRGGFILGGQ